MKIQIDINDQNLGKEVKKLVEAHIKSIARKEVEAIVKDTVNQKIKSYFTKEQFKSVIVNAGENAVGSFFKKSWYGSEDPEGSKYVKDAIKKEIEANISFSSKKFKSLLEESMKESIDKMTKKFNDKLDVLKNLG